MHFRFLFDTYDCKIDY